MSVSACVCVCVSVSLPVCLRAYLRNYTFNIHQISQHVCRGVTFSQKVGVPLHLSCPLPFLPYFSSPLEVGLLIELGVWVVL